MLWSRASHLNWALYEVVKFRGKNQTGLSGHSSAFSAI